MCILLLLVLFAIIIIASGAIDQAIRFFEKSSEMRLYENTAKYIKDKKDYDDLVNMSNLTEFSGNIYYIEPESQLLYCFEKSENEIVISNNNMDYMILTDKIVYFAYNNKLFMQRRESENTYEISEINEETVLYTVLKGDKLLFINDKRRVCSFDIKTSKLKVLSNHNAYSFKVYGDNIFYTTKEYGLNAMYIDGSNQNRLTDAYIWNYTNFVIKNDYVFLTNDSNKILRIDLRKNTYKEITESESVSPFSMQVVNDSLYFESHGEELYLNETDFNGDKKRVLRSYSFNEQCWVANIYSFLGIVSQSVDTSKIYIYNKDNEELKKIDLENTNIYSMKEYDNYIVVKAKKANVDMYIFYDKEFNEIARILPPLDILLQNNDCMAGRQPH